MTRKKHITPVSSGAKWGNFAIFEAEHGGERGVRTPDTRKGITVFETAAFGHSAISPDYRAIICRMFSILQADF